MYIRNMLIVLTFLLFICNGFVPIFADKTSLEKDENSLPSISVSGVVDRIENNELAVLLVEELELEFVVNTNDVDEKLARGVWVDLIIIGTEIDGLTINWEMTKKRGEMIKDLKQEIKNKAPRLELLF